MVQAKKEEARSEERRARLERDQRKWDYREKKLKQRSQQRKERKAARAAKIQRRKGSGEKWTTSDATRPTPGAQDADKVNSRQPRAQTSPVEAAEGEG